MGGIENATYDLVQNKVWKSQTFLIGGTFIARSKIAFLRGCAGGAAGVSAGGTGGGAGAGCEWFPVNLTIGEYVTVIIGAGGAASIGAGGDTSFGSYITLPGAPGAGRSGGATPKATSLSDYINATPVGFIISGAWGGEDTNGGRSTFAGGTGGSGYGGGGGGFYGAGGNGVSSSGTGGAAAANSGAGGGSSSAGTGGAGGSGQLTVYWLE